MWKYIWCLIFWMLSVGCEEYYPLSDQLDDIGLLGQHELRRIEQTAGIDGSIHGSSSMFGGSMDGTITSERKLQFYWGRTKNEYISTTLPYSKFRFIIDDSLGVPTVEFMFDETYLQIQRRAFTESDKRNLNDWINYRYGKFSILNVVIIRISKHDFKKGIYFHM